MEHTIFNKEMETMKRSDMRALQLERLKHIVAYAYERVPFYKKRFDEIGLKPSHIKTLKDVELIPYTTKLDLRDNYPYGLFAVPMKDIVRIHASSGTTGKPVVVGYTRNDMEVWTENVARMITAVGGNSEDVVQISFGYGLFTGALGLHQGWERIGATVVPISSGNTERQLMLMQDLGVTALVATPSYAMYMAEMIEQKKIPLSNFKLRLGLFGSEASTEAMHKELSRKLHVLSTDNYGLTEITGPGVAGQCYLTNGMHINEDSFLCEIFDIENNRAVDEGEEGELLVTTLTKEGIPMLRYRTKDITSITNEPCACGRTTARMARIKGRSDDMLIIKGVNVFPSQIETVLVSMDDVGDHYEIIVRRENYMDSIEVRVEVVDSALLDDYSRLEALEKKIRHNLKTVLQIEAKVSLVEPLSLKRYEGKTKRVIDLRDMSK